MSTATALLMDPKLRLSKVSVSHVPVGVGWGAADFCFLTILQILVAAILKRHLLKLTMAVHLVGMRAETSVHSI